MGKAEGDRFGGGGVDRWGGDRKVVLEIVEANGLQTKGNACSFSGSNLSRLSSTSLAQHLTIRSE